jgi:hypothetical protein
MVAITATMASSARPIMMGLERSPLISMLLYRDDVWTNLVAST